MLERMEYLRRMNDILKSNEEIDNMIQNMKTQEGIFSEEDKILLLKFFREEKDNLINNSMEINKNFNMDELLEVYKNKKK
jgi:hypothetical protein